MKWLWIVCALVVPVEPVMAVPVSFPPVRDTLVAALRRGGYVLVFRHAHTDRSKMDDQTWSLADRSTQRNLSGRGAEEAKRIGRAMAALRIPIGDVLTSPMFRTRETADLAFPRADTTELLRSRGSTPEARALLTMAPAPGTNRVLVTHNAYIGRHLSDRGLGRIQEGDVVMVRPLGEGGFEVLGKITVGQWEQLLLEESTSLPEPPVQPAESRTRQGVQ